jgi:hypothetical protein
MKYPKKPKKKKIEFNYVSSYRDRVRIQPRDILIKRAVRVLETIHRIKTTFHKTIWRPIFEEGVKQGKLYSITNRTKTTGDLLVYTFSRDSFSSNTTNVDKFDPLFNEFIDWGNDKDLQDLIKNKDNKQFYYGHLMNNAEHRLNTINARFYKVYRIVGQLLEAYIRKTNKQELFTEKIVNLCVNNTKFIYLIKSYNELWLEITHLTDSFNSSEAIETINI